MKDALIGYSGFVGSTLLRQREFGHRFRSTNISEIEAGTFDLVVCAAAPAQKWVANRDPQADRQKIDGLISHLGRIECRLFILISTVDVFSKPAGVDEETPVEEGGLHAYGLHRRFLEKFVEDKFFRRLIVRLPGLIGPGLRKNAIFDLLNDNNLDAIDSRAAFQFYPMVNLWYDIQKAVDAGLELAHLTAEPIDIFEAAKQGFGKTFRHTLPGDPARYDMRTRFAKVFGAEGYWQYSRRETIQAIRYYRQSEPRRLKLDP